MARNINSLSMKTVDPDTQRIKRIIFGVAGAMVLCVGLIIGLVIHGNNNKGDEIDTSNLAELTVYDEDVEMILLDSVSETLEMDSTKTMNVTVTPADKINDLKWSSSDPEIATVTQAGVITAKAPGICTITVSSQAGYCTAKCQIIVVKTVLPEGLEISAKRVELHPGETEALVIRTTPEGAINSGITWESSDDTVATVASNGQVSAVGYGTCVVTARSRNDQSLVATCTVSVTADVSGVKLNKSSISLAVGASEELEAEILPSEALSSGVTWSSSNTSFATVSSKGVVKAVRVGSATITCTTLDKKYSATCTVTIYPEIEYLNLSANTKEMQMGDTASLTYTIWPNSVQNQTVYWKSSNESVISIDENGKMFAVGYGSSTIRCTSSINSKVYDECEVTVLRPVSTVSLNNTELSLTVGKTSQLKATVLPSGATNKSVTWETSNASVANVSSSGLVSAVAAGTATITVRTTDGGYAATCKVTVKDPVSSIQFGVSEKTFAEGQAGETVALTISPSTATTSVTVKSSDTSVATVSYNSSTGALVVTPGIPGKSIVTARSTDGTDVSATLTVYVNEVGYQAFQSSTKNGVTAITGLATDWEHYVDPNEITIPKILNGNQVEALADNCFKGQLDDASIKKVMLPSSIKSIGSGAFADNTQLETVNIPSGCQTLGNEAFSNTGLVRVTIPSSVSLIGSKCFYNCSKLQSVTLESGVKNIGSSAFENTLSLTEITIVESVTNIGDSAFKGSGLRNVTFENGKLDVIGSYAFSDTAVQNVTFPESLRTIKDGAFMECVNLESVEMKDLVTQIKSQCFASCTRLKEITISENLGSLASNAFSGIASGATFYVAEDSDGYNSLIGIGIDPAQISLL